MAVKRKPKAIQVDENVQQASAGLATKRWKTVYTAAKHVGMSKLTLGRRAKGGKSRTEAREA